MQEDRFTETSSISLRGLTIDPTKVPLLRMLVEPTDRNGLRITSRLMIDKVTTVPKVRIGRRLGKLNGALPLPSRTSAIQGMGARAGDSQLA